MPGVIQRLRSLRDDATRDEILDFGQAVGGRMLASDQVREELAGLLNMAFRPDPPRRVMEIGTHSGGTLFVFCRMAATDATVISLDLPQGPFGGGYPAWKIPMFHAFARRSQRLHLVRADSHQPETRERIAGLLDGEKLDFLLIDGDHTYAGVRQDFEMYSPFVRPGGLVAFHDIAEHAPEVGCEVDRYWNEIKERYESVELIRDRAQRWAGIGVIRMP